MRPASACVCVCVCVVGGRRRQLLCRPPPTPLPRAHHPSAPTPPLLSPPHPGTGTAWSSCICPPPTPLPPTSLSWRSSARGRRHKPSWRQRGPSTPPRRVSGPCSAAAAAARCVPATWRRLLGPSALPPTTPRHPPAHPRRGHERLHRRARRRGVPRRHARATAAGGAPRHGRHFFQHRRLLRVQAAAASPALGAPAAGGAGGGEQVWGQGGAKGRSEGRQTACELAPHPPIPPPSPRPPAPPHIPAHPHRSRL